MTTVGVGKEPSSSVLAYVGPGLKLELGIEEDMFIQRVHL